MKNYKTIIAAVVAGLACTAITSQAALVSVNQGQNNVDISTTTYAVSGSASVVGTKSSAYNVGDAGTLTSTVYQNDANNTLGGLTFIYSVTLTSGFIGSITANGFTGNILVGNLTSSASTANTFDSVSYNPNFVKFVLNNETAAPVTFSWVVDTSSKTFGGSFGSVQDGNASGNLATLAPVPEPSTVVAGALMLLPFGIGAIRSLRKDRKA